VLVPVLLQRSSIEAATFVVNSTADDGDSYLPDGICDTANFPLTRPGRPPIPPSGICTLRAAIAQANNTPALDTITFNIPGAGPHAIAPRSLLPTVEHPVVIDGATQPGFAGRPLIVLSGHAMRDVPSATGLAIRGGNSTVRGLVVKSFDGVGLLLFGQGNNVVQGNFIGTNATGTGPPGDGNGVDGVRIFGSSGNLIGGATPEARNVISGNVEFGVNIEGDAPGLPATGNKVQGNYIGTDATGAQALPNGSDGVHIHGGADNLIGGTVDGRVIQRVLRAYHWEPAGEACLAWV
jgi:CSLREA domain-containing protein